MKHTAHRTYALASYLGDLDQELERICVIVQQHDLSALHMAAINKAVGELEVDRLPPRCTSSMYVPP